MTSRRALAAALGLAALAPGGAAAAGWSAPFHLAGPFAGQATRTIASLASSGELLAGFSVFHVDDPAVSQGWLATRPKHGRAAPPRGLRGVAQVLDVTFDRRRPVALGVAGTEAVLVDGASRRTLRAVLDGPALGRLEPQAGGRILAAVASAGGVWEGSGGRTRLLGGRTSTALSLASARTAGGRTGLAWLVHGRAMLASPSTQVALVAGRGHALDGLALAPDGKRFTLAVVESWVDRRGYHSVVRIGRTTFAAAGEAASDVTLAGDARVAQVLAFEGCERSGRCWVQVAYRSRGGRFSAPVRVGTVDPGEAPAAAVSSGGNAVVGWVYRGRVYAVRRAPGAAGWGPARRLDRTPYASGLSLAGGARSEVAAVWVQGTVSPEVMGAELR